MELTPQSLRLPEPRHEVENMDIYSAPLEGRREFLRLDFNENTLGPSPNVIKAIKTIACNYISVYPEYDGLKEAVANNLNTPKSCSNIRPTQIGIFNGVDAAIHAIFHTYGNRQDCLLTTTPTFGYYAPCANMQGMETIAVPYETKQLRFPYDKIYKILLNEKPKLLFICNPNNPTGTRINAEKIIELAEISPETLVVIDELYEAFTGDSVLPKIDFNKISNLLILRSLSKTAGLAGLRIGFAIGNDIVINRINRVTGPYDINSFAVIAAFAALKDQSYIDNYIKQVLSAKKWIKNQLILHKVTHHMDGGNYFLIWPKKSPTEITQLLKSRGILVRNMERKTLIEGSIRVSVGTKSQMDHFLSSFLESDQN